VTVTVLVLVLVLGGTVVVVVVVVGGVVVVVVVLSVVDVGSVVVSVVSVDSVVVSEGVDEDDVAGADVVVIGVSDGVVSSDDVSPAITWANRYTMRATRTAPTAPNPTSAAGLRYHSVGSGSPGSFGGGSYPAWSPVAA
jgi:hypothetical protein